MTAFLSANTAVSIGDGAVYAIIGFVIVLSVLLLLVGIFYLFGYLFKNDFFIKKKVNPEPVSVKDESDDELVAVITAAVASLIAEENGEAEVKPTFVIKRISRKK